jgi:uncharacterized alkaline shock family protein YloU
MAITKKQDKNAKNIALETSGDVVGETQITPAVLEVIGQIAAQEVPGVYQMRGKLQDRLARVFGAKAHGKGVEVVQTEEGLVVDAYVFLTYGVAVPKTALAIQDAIQTQIGLMTDLVVTQVNVHVEGIVPMKSDSAIDPNHMFDTQTEVDA